MPSPFPGMDPFLEHPEIFPDLHDRLNTHLSEVLQAGLPPPYYAVIGRRTWIEVSHDERREPFLEVYVRQGSDKRLVTSIEILSLTNKTPGEHGRELYLRKQREILGGKVHLVEIDLLRGGEHSTAVPCQRVRAEVGPFDYHVCMHHFDNLEDYFIYPIQLHERLPQIAIPLLPGDPAVTIDLQTLLDHLLRRGTLRPRSELSGGHPSAAARSRSGGVGEGSIAAHPTGAVNNEHTTDELIDAFNAQSPRGNPPRRKLFSLSSPKWSTSGEPMEAVVTVAHRCLSRGLCLNDSRI
jgi:hypothetical protein